MTDRNEAAALEAAWAALIDGGDPAKYAAAYITRKELSAAIAAYKQALPAAPGDWVLVPREPTPEMCEAADLDWHGSMTSLPFRSRYAAMLDAAPSAPLASTVAAPGVDEKIRAALWTLIRVHLREDADLKFTIQVGAVPGYSDVIYGDYIEAWTTVWDYLHATPVAASGPTLGSEAHDDMAKWLAEQPQGATQALKDAAAFYRANYRGDSHTSAGRNMAEAHESGASLGNETSQLKSKHAAMSARDIEQQILDRIPSDALAVMEAERAVIEAAKRNSCVETAAKALRYLAEHPRPVGGEEPYNSLHAHQLSDELDRVLTALSRLTPQGEAQEKK